MALIYRMHKPEDRDELIDLWSTHGGWDEINSEIWEHRFVRTPLGEAAVAVAVDEAANRIVGQFVFIPSLVSIDGREVRAYRPFAPLLAETARGFQSLNPLDHPIFQMYRLAIDSFRQQGVGLIHMMPDPRWARWFQFVPIFQTGKFPLYSLKLPLTETFALPDGYSVEKIEASDERLDELWRKAAKFYDCAIVRNRKMLAWKTSHGSYIYLGIKRGAEFVAFVASIYKQHDRQWLICDTVAAEAEAMHAALAAACNLAEEYRRSNPEQPLDKAAVLATDAMQPILREMNFYRDKYDFPLVVQLLDTTLTKEQIAPSRWYASAND